MTQKQNKKELFLVVDGSSVLATSYYGTLPKEARREKDEEIKDQMLRRMLPKDNKGRCINAVRQFLHVLFTIIEFQKPTHIAICWDCGRDTFRRSLWPKYKEKRKATPPTLKEQFPAAYEICAMLGFLQFQDPDLEADDFAGTLARAMESEMPVRILTRDKDFFQLITPRTHVWYGMSENSKVTGMRRRYRMPSNLPSKTVEIDSTVLESEFNMRPEHVVMIKALCGDVSDNFPGVNGIGEKRALVLVRHYATIEALFEEVDACRSKKQAAALNAKWRSWGIKKSCLRPLSAKGSGERLAAREMAMLCHTLGKIRTDIDLELYLPCSFDVQLFALPISTELAEKKLSALGIRLNLAKRKKKTNPKTGSPVGGQKNKTKQQSAAQADKKSSKQTGQKPKSKYGGNAVRPAAKNVKKNAAGKHAGASNGAKPKNLHKKLNQKPASSHKDRQSLSKPDQKKSLPKTAPNGKAQKPCGTGNKQTKSSHPEGNKNCRKQAGSKGTKRRKRGNASSKRPLISPAQGSETISASL